MLSSKQTTNNTKIVEHDDKTAVHNAHPLAASDRMSYGPWCTTEKFDKYMTHNLQQHTI